MCTEHNTVYAFDADSRSDSPLWSENLGPSLPASVISSDRDIVNEIGITSTPVIDLASNTIYVVAETYEDTEAIFRLHALDIRTGSEKFGGPAVIKGSVTGTSADSSGGVLTFFPLMQWQRPGLLLWNGRIYIAFGSHQDSQPYHGWIFAYDALTLQQRAIRCLTPDGLAAGVWQAGVGLTVDADGNIYVQTGHAEGVTQGVSLGDSLVKLSTQNDLEVVDYFSPSNRDVLDDNDLDFGSSGPILIPGTPTESVAVKMASYFSSIPLILGSSTLIRTKWFSGGRLHIAFWMRTAEVFLLETFSTTQRSTFGVAETR